MKEALRVCVALFFFKGTACVEKKNPNALKLVGHYGYAICSG